MPLNEKNKQKLYGGLIGIGILALGYFIKSHFDKKDQLGELKIIQTSKGSSKQVNTNNQPSQTNNNNGDVKNENVAGDKAEGDKVQGDKIAGDKVMHDKIVNPKYDNRVDNSTKAPVTRNNTTIINQGTSKPPARELDEKDKARLSQMPTADPVTFLVETGEESDAFGLQIYNYLLGKGYKISAVNRVGQLVISGGEQNDRFMISANSIEIKRQ